jgi:hypothetical protein
VIGIDCLLCLDGNVPAGIHPFIGPAYEACPHCLHACDSCEGLSLFPSDYTCPACFAARLAAIGLAVVLCGRCSGVVDLIQTAPNPEVTCHEHH